MTTYNTAITFPTKSEALAHLDMFGYQPLPVRNRFAAQFVGDEGEKRIGFAHIEQIGEYCGEHYVTTAFTVHEVEAPLGRG